MNWLLTDLHSKNQITLSCVSVLAHGWINKRKLHLLCLNSTQFVQTRWILQKDVQVVFWVPRCTFCSHFHIQNLLWRKQYNRIFLRKRLVFCAYAWTIWLNFRSSWNYGLNTFTSSVAIKQFIYCSPSRLDSQILRNITTTPAKLSTKILTIMGVHFYVLHICGVYWNNQM